LETPIVRIHAINSCSVAANASSDDAGGLETVLLLAKGAKVMLSYNIWQQAGLCNGATGNISDFLYTNGNKPPCPLLFW